MPPAQPDFEELCAQLRTVVDRTDLSNDEKVATIGRLLHGEAAPAAGNSPHRWRETGSVPLEDGAGEGQSVQYACSKCGAKGYQIVFPTSVTMYPIVTDTPLCQG